MAGASTGSSTYTLLDRGCRPSALPSGSSTSQYWCSPPATGCSCPLNSALAASAEESNRSELTPPTWWRTSDGTADSASPSCRGADCGQPVVPGYLSHELAAQVAREVIRNQVGFGRAVRHVALPEVRPVDRRGCECPSLCRRQLSLPFAAEARNPALLGFVACAEADACRVAAVRAYFDADEQFGLHGVALFRRGRHRLQRRGRVRLPSEADPALAGEAAAQVVAQCERQFIGMRGRPPVANTTSCTGRRGESGYGGQLHAYVIGELPRYPCLDVSRRCIRRARQTAARAGMTRAATGCRQIAGERRSCLLQPQRARRGNHQVAMPARGEVAVDFLRESRRQCYTPAYGSASGCQFGTARYDLAGYRGRIHLVKRGRPRCLSRTRVDPGRRAGVSPGHRAWHTGRRRSARRAS